MEKLVYDEVEHNAWVEHYEWAGIVYPRDIHESVAFITPLAFYDQNDGWQVITESECNEYFPNNGRVARFTGDFPKQKVARLYWFQPVLNQRSFLSEDTTRYSRYLTYSDSTPTSEPLSQVFDWSSRANHLFALPDLLDQGIPTEDCRSQTIFIRYQDLAYGPIHLEQDFRNNQVLKPREYNQRSSSFGQLLLLNGYNFAREKILRLADQSFIDQKMLGSPVSLADWSLPQMTIKRLLGASKGLSSDLQEKQRLTDKVIRDLATLSAANGPEALHLEECVIRRAQYIIRHQIERLDNLQALIEELPKDHPLLEQARSVEVQQRKQQIAQACEVEQSHLQTLQTDAQSAQEALARLNDEIEVAKEKKEQMNAGLVALEASLPQRLAELREEMLGLFKDLHITATLPMALFQANAGETTAETQQSEVSPPIHQQHYFIDDNSTTITDPGDIRWAEIATQNRMSIKHVRAGAAALLAGLIPAVSNATLLQAVAQGIAGQRIWRVPVPLTGIDPLDLFGDISPESRSFVPVAGELADILIEAQDHPGQLGLIVLEGIDRVPFLPVIEPLLRQYRAVQQHIQQTRATSPCEETLQLFHPLALAPEDPYQKISRLGWPANLLLGVTFDEEIGSFPLPEPYTSWFAHIQYIEADDQANSHWSGPRKSWQVSSMNWYAWEKKSANGASSQNVLSQSEDFAPWQQVFYAALGIFGMKKDLRDIIEQLWPEQD